VVIRGISGRVVIIPGVLGLLMGTPLTRSIRLLLFKSINGLDGAVETAIGSSQAGGRCDRER
jgi:hypothetical protein